MFLTSNDVANIIENEDDENCDNESIVSTASSTMSQNVSANVSLVKNSANRRTVKRKGRIFTVRKNRHKTTQSGRLRNESSRNRDATDDCYENGSLSGKNYKFVGFLKEDHKHPIFGVAINNYVMRDEKRPKKVIFATVGCNRVTIYQALRGGASEETGDFNSSSGMQLLQCFADPDPDEQFYCCAWTYDVHDGGKPLLAAAGSRGIIRILSPSTMNCIQHLIGHGQCINQLKVHPVDPSLLLSVSKDHAMRLWNIWTGHCILIFGGVEGHRDEVLSADFNVDGSALVSGGMDHSLKVWRLDTPVIESKINQSYTHSVSALNRAFPTHLVHFPHFSTRDVHRNYVDCVQWLGSSLVLSKSCENSIICWRPSKSAFTLNKYDFKEDDFDDESVAMADSNKESTSPCSDKITILQNFELKDCQIWFVRFSVNETCTTLVSGNQNGKIFIWNLNSNGGSSTGCSLPNLPSAKPCQVLNHGKCVSAIRQVAMSSDASMIIGVCDDASIWRWDRSQ